MRHYELMVILDPSLDERTVQPSLETFLNVIRTSGGNVEKVEVWGKRRLVLRDQQARRGHLRRARGRTASPPRSRSWTASWASTSPCCAPRSCGATPPAGRREQAGGSSMAGDTVITVVGNLTADPELRFTPSGAAVANFTVASTPAHLRPPDRRVEGRRGAVPAVQHLASGRGERRRVAHPRRPRHGAAAGSSSGPSRPVRARSAPSSSSRSTRSARRCGTPPRRSTRSAAAAAAAASAAAAAAAAASAAAAAAAAAPAADDPWGSAPPGRGSGGGSDDEPPF